MLRSDVTALAQTEDGYLWVGTRSGLLRFDGVRFEPWESIGGPAYPSPTIYSLSSARDGSLWVGMRNKLIRWKDGTATSIRGNLTHVTMIVQAKDGTIWFSESRVPSDGPICRVDGDQARCLSARDTPRITGAVCIAEDPSGGMLFCGASDLGLLKDGRFETVPTTIPKTVNFPSSLAAVLVRTDGTLLLGMNRVGPGLGLQRRSAAAGWAPIVEDGFNSSTFQTTRLIEDGDGTLWIGTADTGLYRVVGNHIDHFDSAKGLTDDTVNDVLRDREGNLWVATSKGLDMFRGLKVNTFSKTEGLGLNNVQSVSSSPTGDLAVGNVSRLDLISSPTGTVHPMSGLPKGQITSATYDPRGRLWVGVDQELYLVAGSHPVKILCGDRPLGIIYRIVQGRQNTIWVDTFEGMTHRISKIQDDHVKEQFDAGGVVTSMAAGSHDDLWLGFTTGALAHVQNDHVSTVVPPSPDKASRKVIVSLLAGSDGLVLAGTSAGLLGWRNGRQLHLTVKNGLPCNAINDLALDSDAHLWLSSDCGYFMLTQQQIQTLWQHPETSVTIRLLDVFDGAVSGQPTFSPANALAPDGRLWFANGSVLQFLDPHGIKTNTRPPPVHVQSITADGKPVLTGASLNLPAKTREVQIAYTALSLSVPQKVHFRYKLEGWDEAWQDVGTRREAFYTNLPPGQYTFHVLACNEDGVWNETGAVTSFYLRPSFYQTIWFKVLLAVLCVSAILLLVFLRLQFLAFQMQEKWAVRLNERERIARELHDTFLQGVQGLLLRIKTATRRVEPDSPARAELEDALRLSAGVLATGRTLVQTIRSTIQPRSVLSELETVGRELQSLYPIAFQAHSVGRVRELNSQVEEELCKIGREAISNAFHHARASAIAVRLTFEQRCLTLTVHDDGIGIDRGILVAGARSGHWGLPGIRERVEGIRGTLRLESAPGEGTTLEVKVNARKAYGRSALRWPRWLGTSWRETSDDRIDPHIRPDRG